MAQSPLCTHGEWPSSPSLISLAVFSDHDSLACAHCLCKSRRHTHKEKQAIAPLASTRVNDDNKADGLEIKRRKAKHSSVCHTLRAHHTALGALHSHTKLFGQTTFHSSTCSAGACGSGVRTCSHPSFINTTCSQYSTSGADRTPWRAPRDQRPTPTVGPQDLDGS